MQIGMFFVALIGTVWPIYELGYKAGNNVANEHIKYLEIKCKGYEELRGVDFSENIKNMNNASQELKKYIEYINNYEYNKNYDLMVSKYNTLKSNYDFLEKSLNEKNEKIQEKEVIISNLIVKPKTLFLKSGQYSELENGKIVFAVRITVGSQARISVDNVEKNVFTGYKFTCETKLAIYDIIVTRIVYEGVEFKIFVKKK